MTNRPECPKGRRKTGSPCVFCEDGSYCPHQYYCPATRRYENSGFRRCKKLNGKPERSSEHETSNSDRRNRRKRRNLSAS